MPAPLSEAEKDLLKVARDFQDLVKLDAWKRYVAILDSHIAQRQALLERPMAEFRLEGASSMDGLAMVASMECIKGALIGLRLAVSLPDVILQEAEGLRKRAGEEGEKK